MSESYSQMLKIRFDEFENAEYEKNKKSVNIGIRELSKEAKRRAKRNECFICQKQCSSFCNSHTVPQFCLKRIAINGHVYISGLQKEYPILGDDVGVSKAGTFHLICNTCDNTLFQDYENPDAYVAMPSNIMLAQIAMKNYLRLISKRLIDRETHKIIYDKQTDPVRKYQQLAQLITVPLDLKEYEDGYNRAKLATKGKHDDWYHMFFYTKLDYVVPVAFQGSITLISGFDDEIINDIYNFDPNYRTKDLHISIFPLKNETVIFAFIDSRNKVYRKFYKHLLTLPLEDQLATINYIVLSNSEDIFIAKTEKINNEVMTNRAFLDVCQTTRIGKYDGGKKRLINTAAESFSLSKRNDIPNLLSKEYAL